MSICAKRTIPIGGRPSAAWGPAISGQTVDLDGAIGSAGAISQTFATEPGATYEVTYWLAGNYASGPAVKTGTVTAGGASQAISFDTTGKSATNMGYEKKTLTFVADGSGESTLAFASSNNSGYGPVISNVSVTKVQPAPIPAIDPVIASTSAAAAMGAGSFFLIRRRRKANEASM
ncbi:DUF642 domain-containing protein [Streptomyces sp. AK02-04a]|uniref:DUF642 domain-containing protein n=1 Tax=Streptomyces sp. AK02-04a TaxID=3028649 RepID=UPI0029B1ABB8|nr:DUF642 domain-containing protein [Streptomyces sp. AK02-04a]MDX3763829.1 DUF642 domain-containing protein [Streptomyces sp. AK02-04a]